MKCSRAEIEIGDFVSTAKNLGVNRKDKSVLSFHLGEADLRGEQHIVGQRVRGRKFW